MLKFESFKDLDEATIDALVEDTPARLEVNSKTVGRYHFQRARSPVSLSEEWWALERIARLYEFDMETDEEVNPLKEPQVYFNDDDYGSILPIAVLSPDWFAYKTGMWELLRPRHPLAKPQEIMQRFHLRDALQQLYAGEVVGPSLGSYHNLFEESEIEAITTQTKVGDTRTQGIEFLGQTAEPLKLDDRGRVSIPAPFLDLLRIREPTQYLKVARLDFSTGPVLQVMGSAYFDSDYRSIAPELMGDPKEHNREEVTVQARKFETVKIERKSRIHIPSRFREMLGDSAHVWGSRDMFILAPATATTS